MPPNLCLRPLSTLCRAGTRKRALREAPDLPLAAEPPSRKRARRAVAVEPPPPRDGRQLPRAPAAPAPMFDRDIVSFDLETTGLKQTTDRIIEFGAQRLYKDGTRGPVFVQRINTDHPIHPEAAKAHGITKPMLEGQPHFAQVAPRLLEQLRDADLVGYNCKAFDKNFLRNEMARVGVVWPPAGARMFDCYRAFTHFVTKESAGGRHRLANNAYPFYCGKPLEDAHNAGVDASATLDVFLEQLRVHPLPHDMQQLNDRFCTDGVVVSHAKEDILVAEPKGFSQPDEAAALRYVPRLRPSMPRVRVAA